MEKILFLVTCSIDVTALMHHFIAQLLLIMVRMVSTCVVLMCLLFLYCACVASCTAYCCLLLTLCCVLYCMLRGVLRAASCVLRPACCVVYQLTYIALTIM